MSTLIPKKNHSFHNRACSLHTLIWITERPSQRDDRKKIKYHHSWFTVMNINSEWEEWAWRAVYYTCQSYLGQSDLPWLQYNGPISSLQPTNTFDRQHVILSLLRQQQITSKVPLKSCFERRALTWHAVMYAFILRYTFTAKQTPRWWIHFIQHWERMCFHR